MSHESARRALADVVLDRAEHLDNPERALIQQVYGQGVRTDDLAAVLGVSRRTVQRRLQRLVERLTDPLTVFVIRHQARWDRLTAAIAVSVWVKGLPLRQAAARHDVSLHTVRQRLAHVKGMHAAAEALTRRPRRPRRSA
mgnify:CR=1 FL=1